LRLPLRAGATDEELIRLIGKHWTARGDRYSERRAELRALGDPARVEMFTIGG